MALWRELPKADKDMINEIMTAYYYSEKGILPKAGGWQDQDRFIIECIPIVHRYVNAEMERKYKHRAKGGGG